MICICAPGREGGREGAGGRRAGGARGAGGLGTGGPGAAWRDTPGETWEWAARVWRGGYTGKAVGVGCPGDGVRTTVSHPEMGKYTCTLRGEEEEVK